ncbi:Cathepsin F [Balamuthia mandrillaris]
MGRVAFAVVLLALLAVAYGKVLSVNDEDLGAWGQFKDFLAAHPRDYATTEELSQRFAIFKSNLARIEGLNRRMPSARFAPNKFADLTPEEFKQQYLMKDFEPSAHAAKAANLMPAMPAPPQGIPTNFDWRDKGAVTKVKDQGQCGSCWAFSATEAIESQWFLAGNPLTVLSEQQIVDCDKGRGDFGCNGGDTVTAYAYVVDAGGLDSEKDYPYTARDGQCKFKSDSVAAKISGFRYVTKNRNETEMQLGLLSSGPLSICVDAETWQFYQGGVISSFCGTSLDHCVMITGFSDQKGWDYYTYHVWNIRNSWGEGWGYDGYIYVQRDYNLCGVAEEVTLPTV